MDLYFVNDQPKMIYDTWKYARVRQNCEKMVINSKEYYICDARNYQEALDQLLLRSKQYDDNKLSESFKTALMHATGVVIDHTRGDGFTLLMIPFGEWHELLTDYKIPPEYL